MRTRSRIRATLPSSVVVLTSPALADLIVGEPGVPPETYELPYTVGAALFTLVAVVVSVILLRRVSRSRERPPAPNGPEDTGRQD